ncbi:MFS transporter [Skermania piniformis]|uniref:MFS transporter n=1 Tax=Skermania pinensis TaxID=39122 RepID=UPI000B20617B|nr:MFS transporter [Skermania piniformis]
MRALQPLQFPAYRWLFGSLVCSLLAEGMFLVAQVWQVVELGGGPGQLALVTTATAVGMVGTVLVGGVLADRIPQKRILLGVAAVQTAVCAVLAVLSLSGLLTLWQLVAGALMIGIAGGLYFPAYSALVPALVPAEQLLAVNGLEGMTRPALAQAAGPAAASGLIAAASPGAALAVAALTSGLTVLFVSCMPLTPVRRAVDDGSPSARRLVQDVADGFRYMARTPWLLATLLFASLMVLVIIGPLEVLVPFAIRDHTGGGPREHALVLVAFGVGAVVGPAIVASRPLPRRYLTVMVTMWGVGCVPMVVFGLTSQLWLMIVAAFVTGLLFDGAQVIWGTLLQRRVPAELLGRISSLDFFVSLAFMPVSMALSGTVAGVVGLKTVFLVAGLVPIGLAVIAIAAARMRQDELSHPLDAPSVRVPDHGFISR